MKHILKIMLSVLLLVGQACAESDWLHDRMAEMNAMQGNLSGDQIDRLLLFASIAASRFPNEDQKAVYTRAQQMLLESPGFAEHVKNKVENARRDCLSHKIYFLRYADIQPEIGRLGYVKSPESVAVLGHFLNDSEGRDGKSLIGGEIQVEDASYPVNASSALSAIERIGIENPPTSNKYLSEWEQVDVWKDWWNEVKAGKRTYRFKGSPIEYGPDGPASKETIERLRNEQVRRENGSTRAFPTERGSDDKQTAQSSRWKLVVTGLGAAVVLLAMALHLKQRRKAARH